MSEVDARIRELEERVEALERRTGVVRDREGSRGHGPPPSQGQPRPQETTRLEQVVLRKPPRNLAPQVLGIGGVAALVLAASYLVRLAIDSGWLTPVRQLAAAAVAGIGCVGMGLALRSTGRRYAALLSAGGVVVLYLTVYAAHLHYGFIESGLATALVVALSLCALALGRVFHTRLYAFIAVVGAYSTPFLVDVEQASVMRLVLYYSAWSGLFCCYSLWVGGRHAYLVASVLAIVGFDLIWRFSGEQDWTIAATYQAVQFLLFSATTAFYSARHRAPLTPVLAKAHAPSLFIFYAIEYTILDAHIPRQAPWIALASVLILVLAYRAVRSRLDGAKAGATLVSTYAALVLFQAGYVELWPDSLQPWLALALFVVPGVPVARAHIGKPVLRPLVVSGALVCVTNYLRVITDVNMDEVPLATVIYIAYAIVLYAAYAKTTKPVERTAALYSAHVAALAAGYYLLDTRVLVSVSWGVLAIGCLLIALRTRDRLLAQSSFLVFAVSSFKVLVNDLEGSAPLVRIGCLVALGASLYAGGWLYQRIDPQEVDAVEASRHGPGGGAH